MHTLTKNEQVVGVERWLGAALPAEYVMFLRSHNGTVIGEQILLYAAELLVERNETYETKTYCPGYRTIGDDSGGRAVVIQIDQPLDQVYLVGHGSMSPRDFKLLPMTFNAWVENGCPIE